MSLNPVTSPAIQLIWEIRDESITRSRNRPPRPRPRSGASLSVQHDLARAHHVEPVGVLERAMGALLDDEQRDPGRAKRMQDVVDDWTISGARPRAGSSSSTSLGGSSGRARSPVAAARHPRACRPASEPLPEEREMAEDALEVGLDPARSRRIWLPSRRFSSTVSWVKTCRFSGTSETPMRAIVSGARPPIGSPASRIAPALGRSAPAIGSSVVVLPAPLAQRCRRSRRPRPGPRRRGPPAPGRSGRADRQPRAALRASGSRAEIGLDHGRVALDLLRRAFGDRPAARDHVDALADPHDHPHVVLDQQHAAPEFCGDPRDQPHQLVALGIRQPGRRLVQQHEAGRHRERAADADQPLPAIGQRVGELEGPVLEAHPAQDPGCPLLGSRRRPRRRPPRPRGSRSPTGRGTGARPGKFAPAPRGRCDAAASR